MSGRASFVIDLNRCTGCHACELACSIVNDLPVGRHWRRVRTYNERHLPDVEQFHLSLACNHCGKAPCVDQCPARAFRRDPDTGAVLIDEKSCVGCRYCSWVCPYEALRFDSERGVMTKCTSCNERRREGREPACVTGCPTGALTWSVVSEKDLVQDAPGFVRAGTKPAVRIITLEEKRRTPETTHPPATSFKPALHHRLTGLVSLRHEWSLALFTLLLAALAGFFAASHLNAASPGWPLFVITGATGLLLSATHLGQKRRAWRAALHADSSWLSREIVFFGGFLILGASASIPDEPPSWLAWAALVTGFAAAAAADMVYRVAVIRGAGLLHSALVLPTALLLAAVWSSPLQPGVKPALAFLAIWKGGLYFTRKRNRARLGLPVRWYASVLRLGLLAAGTLILLPAGTGSARLAGALLILTAELIDRCEYYDELEIPTPESLMLDHLDERLGVSRGVR